MKLTAITGSLNPSTLKKLTANASDPTYKTLRIRTKLDAEDLRGLLPRQIGEVFHRASASLLGREDLPRENRHLYPFINAVRTHLRQLGYTRFFPEFILKHGSVTGRADVVVNGPGGRAVVEFKVTDLPWLADDETMVQAANYGYMLPPSSSYVKTALVLYYVDLGRGRIGSYHWNDFRDASRPLREFSAA